MAVGFSLRSTRQAEKPRKSCGRKKRRENEFERQGKERRWRERLTMSVLNADKIFTCAWESGGVLFRISKKPLKEDTWVTMKKLKKR